MTVELQKPQELPQIIVQKQSKVSIIKQNTKERFMSPEERQKFVNDLRLIYKNNNGRSKSDKFLRNTPNQPSKFKTKK